MKGCLAQVLILPNCYEFLSLLTELYYEDPLHLIELSKMSQNMSQCGDSFDEKNIFVNRFWREIMGDKVVNQLRDNLPEFAKPAFELPQYQKFLKGHLPLRPGREKSFELLALTTSFAVLKRLDDSPAFRIFMADKRPVSEIRDQTGGATPFEAGLRLLFCGELDHFENHLNSYITERWFSTGHDENLAKDDSQGSSKPLFDEAHTQLLFAPSGSGKTNSIFEELKRKYGYYIVSSALGKGDDAHSSGFGQNIFDPKVLQGVSRDTRELFNLLHSINPLSFGHNATWMILIVFWHRIMETRCRVFRIFREAGKLKSSPELWLSFQLDCDEWDPFLYIFRVLSLFNVHTNRADSIQNISSRISYEHDSVQWVCLDEAQEDLRYLPTGYNSARMLDAAMSGMFFQGFSQRAIFAGTSFNLRRAIEFRRLLDKFPFAANKFWIKGSYKSVLDFPLVMDESDLKKVLRNKGLKSQKILDIAAEHGSALFGRIKWTAMFAERILTELEKMKLSDSDTHTNDEYNALNLRHLADETYETVVAHLIGKLRTIEERGDGSELLNQLLEAAISADIRGLPHVFQHDSDMELVERGFAMVRTKIDQFSTELEQYFTIVTKKTNLLEARLTNSHDVEAGTIHLLSQAARSKFSISDFTINAITPEIATRGFTIVDCQTTKIESDLQKQRYNRNGRANRRLGLETKLSGWNFSIEHKTANNLFVRLKEGATIDEKTADEVKLFLEKHSYININIPIADLSKLVRKGFSIQQPTLVGELKERVVIDAILRFFDSKLNDKLIHSIRGVSRTGLGHPAEYFLAIVSLPHSSAVERELKESCILKSFLLKSQQLRQIFTSSPDNGDRLHEEWGERHRRVKASLAQAENNLGNKSSQITDLKESTLVSGKQTVMNSDSLNDWITKFLAWLTAIENGFKPCGSFLLPHNDFGPDLIFALRTKTENIILCSIQVSQARRRSSSL